MKAELESQKLALEQSKIQNARHLEDKSNLLKEISRLKNKEKTDSQSLKMSFRAIQKQISNAKERLSTIESEELSAD